MEKSDPAAGGGFKPFVLKQIGLSNNLGADEFVASVLSHTQPPDEPSAALRRAIEGALFELSDNRVDAVGGLTSNE